MYGLVNQAFHDMIVERFGKEVWKDIQGLSGVSEEVFISTVPYEDNLTYELIGATAERSELTVNEILEDFGVYWILNTGHKKYGELMRAGGSDFSEFLLNLPRFHDRIMLIYPEMNPPEFRVEKHNEKTFSLDYFSTRVGLSFFVIGLIKGIAKMFDQEIRIVLVESSEGKNFHDRFEITLVE